jgi:hypothetical protein
MKKILIAIIIIIITITAWRESSVVASTPSKPSPIQDPLLQQAWERLNALTEPVQLPDGSILTGHDLAQFILNKNIPIEWDENNVCGGNSCSVRYHVHGKTTYTHDEQPIYIRLALKAEATGQMSLLVESMAHEIFHYTEPFGQVDDSLYEEYVAFNSSARIAHTSGMDDTCANPMQPACLKHWFEVHNLMYGYTQIQVYPDSLANSIDTTSPLCWQKEETTTEQPAAVATQAPSTANPACTINAMGLVDCQHEEATGPTSQYATSTPVEPGSIYDCKTNHVGFIECHYETPTAAP